MKITDYFHTEWEGHNLCKARNKTYEALCPPLVCVQGLLDVKFADRKRGKAMKFIAQYCHRCKLYFRELELGNGKCPECKGAVIPQPMETQEDK